MGDIWDEHDEETQQIFKVDEHSYEVMGETTMDDVYEEILNTRNKHIDGYQPLSGYLMEKLERILVQGDSYSDEFLKYTVTIIDENRIKKVNIRIHQPEDFEI